MKSQVRHDLDRLAPLIAGAFVALYFYLMLMSKPPGVVKTMNAIFSSGGGAGFAALFYVVPGIITFCVVFLFSQDAPRVRKTLPAFASAFGPIVGLFLNPGVLTFSTTGFYLGSAFSGAFFTWLFRWGMRRLLERTTLPEGHGNPPTPERGQ